VSMQLTSVHPEPLARNEAESESATGRTMMVIAIAWFVAAATMGFAGFFTAYARFLFPFVLAPLMVFVAAFAASLRVRAWAFAQMPARTGRQRGLLLVWLVFGIADFAISIPFAVVARLTDPASVVAVNEFPEVLIPMYFVPLVLAGYFVVLAQLWQQRKSMTLRADR